MCGLESSTRPRTSIRIGDIIPFIRLKLAALTPFLAISGGLLALGFPPLGLWPLALVALAPLLACLRDVSLGRGWLNAFLGLWVGDLIRLRIRDL